ncbi:alpha/beta hydrolase [Dickeya sp. ws52]|uniref:alpha/beta hydrolase n=1 Tax=Dickeya sp. ws52 TaxID=2576377 RepID=UPI00118127FB|nr:alpha/beta hydrolase [Dickeya sp. ws52]TYL41844.1 alpha/beta hydrolase [Dickeya sp. ws52]
MKKCLVAALLAAVTGNAAAADNNAPYAERHVQTFLGKLNAGGGKPIEQLSPAEAREVLVAAQAGANLPAADVTQKTITVDGQKIPLIIVKPAGSTGVLPVFMFFHGGGWILGDYPTHERFVRDLVVQSGAAAVFVDYSRSPEVHYPVAIRQAYAATRWVAENGKEIGVDGSRLALAGNSVGGNMVAAVAQQAKQAGAPRIRYQVMFWPVTDANFDTASYQQFQKGYFLSRSMMEWFWDAYTTDGKQRRDVLASPLQGTREQLKGLPPALIQTAELDVLRDEGEAYGRKLDAAGVDVTVTRYNGMIHDFGLLNALSDVPATRAALLQASTELRERLK